MEILLFLVAVAGAIYFFRQHQTSQKARLAAEALARTLADEASNLDSRLKASQSDLRAAKDQVVNAQAEVAAVRRRVDEAKPYLEVADTAAEAVRIRRRAQEDADRAVADGRVAAEAIVDEAKAEAKQKREAAARRLEELEQQARAAERQAGEIIEQAREKAMAIAGDAYKALENAESLKSVVQALQNRIEGYGDRYVAPTYSLLDELAGAYSFDEAGRALKAARDRTQRMVEDGLAADCEYVEKDRRETAIRFVIDAFNGKADTILGRIKSDNYGTLRQEVLDAFALVNANGQAFRNARIQPSFRDSRLDELKFAEAVVALRDRDREEQRRIKEQIREEERAQRGFERAQRDAAKEEEAVQKAMQRMQGLMEKASDEQRAKYEGQMAELKQRLAEAEAKSQRALSMAQQTKAGHVYVISNVGSFGENVYKVGMTRRLEPLDRIAELGDASVPFPFDVHAMLYSEDAPALERKLHRKLLLNQVNKVNPRKEFFRSPLADIRSQLEAEGVQGAWTMAATAAQFRESQSIEERLSTDPEARAAWMESQMRADPVTYSEADQPEPSAKAA